MKVLELGKGKRTYLIGAVVFVLGGLQALGVIDQTILDKIETVLIGAGLITLRAGMK